MFETDVGESLRGIFTAASNLYLHVNYMGKILMSFQIWESVYP